MADVITKYSDTEVLITHEIIIGLNKIKFQIQQQQEKITNLNNKKVEIDKLITKEQEVLDALLDQSKQASDLGVMEG